MLVNSCFLKKFIFCKIIFFIYILNYFEMLILKKNLKILKIYYFNVFQHEKNNRNYFYK
jgi:hypothetical protein